MRSGYAVITPWLVPDGSCKRANIGDAFILDAAVKLIGSPPAAVFSRRQALSEEAIAAINGTRLLVAPLANGLTDAFELAPGLDPERLEVPVAVLGVGLTGRPQGALTPDGLRRIEAILERFPFISVRCDASARYLGEALPASRRDAVLMTSCPVAYPTDGIDRGFVRKERYGTAVVTVTDRNRPGYPWTSQLSILADAQRLIAADRYVLALHQDFGRPELHEAARGLGYEVLASADYADYLALYGACDVHYGNRVHGHLKALANGVPSWCAPFDRRHWYFGQSLDFPVALGSIDKGYDFDRFVAARDRARPRMEAFIAAVRKVIG